MPATHMIGAYGMFWDRDEVNWNPGSGSSAWQLLGRVHKLQPALQVCDFRRAQGFLVLFDEFRATYVGLARGRFGIGARLRAHVAHRDRWSRFSWFAIDDIAPDRLDGWSKLRPREKLPGMTSETILRECEALLITILGSKDQNAMRFQRARQWHQLTEADFLPSGIARRVDPAGFKERRLRDLANTGGER